jgi:peptidoglycan/LPS O-acetylase OafA/YrhL
MDQEQMPSTSADADLRHAERLDYESRVDAVERQERPFGISLIVTLIVLGVLLNAFLALNAWIRAAELRETPTLAIFLILEVLVGIALAVGLWGLREWARMVAVVWYGLVFVFNFFSNFNEPLTAASLMGLVVPVAIVIYLVQPQVRDVFV